MRIVRNLIIFTSAFLLFSCSCTPKALIRETKQTTRKLPEGMIWYAGFEKGNLDEWLPVGGFVSQASADYYSIVSPQAHNGKYSVELRIDTSQPSDTGSHASYLFYWDKLPGSKYYYSAWYYIPSGIKPSEWWIISQWKSAYNENSDDSKPMYIIGITEVLDEYWLYMEYRPDDEDKKMRFTQYEVSVPKDQWFQIESLYPNSTSGSDTVIVWLNDTEVFNISGNPTVLDANMIYWSVNNYAERIDPQPCSIYVDDVVISKVKLGSSYNYEFIDE